MRKQLGDVLKISLLAVATLISGCSTLTPTFVPILGSNRGWSDASKIKVIHDISVSDLRIRVTTPSTNTDCVSGAHHTIEIDGPINKDTSYVLGRILKDLPKCVSSSGKTNVNTVYLNSNGGTLDDGYAIGRIFKEFSVSVNVTEKQICASSCAVAFLGGSFRSIQIDGKLIFHAPYTTNNYGGIVCAEKSEAQALKNHYRQMIARDSADKLFERTMDYCSSRDGWTLDQGAANIFGLLK
jgi:ATP-dependent protease ClpP protease subunit